MCVCVCVGELIFVCCGGGGQQSCPFSVSTSLEKVYWGVRCRELPVRLVRFCVGGYDIYNGLPAVCAGRRTSACLCSTHTAHSHESGLEEAEAEVSKQINYDGSKAQ